MVCIRYILYPLHTYCTLGKKSCPEKLTGWFHFKRPVGSLCVVPEEVLHQSDVELFWVKEFILSQVGVVLPACAEADRQQALDLSNDIRTVEACRLSLWNRNALNPQLQTVLFAPEPAP